MGGISIVADHRPFAFYKKSQKNQQYLKLLIIRIRRKTLGGLPILQWQSLLPQLTNKQTAEQVVVVCLLDPELSLVLA